MVFVVAVLEQEEVFRERERESKQAFISFRLERLYLIYFVVRLVDPTAMAESWPNSMFWRDLGAYHSFHIAISFGSTSRYMGKEGAAVCSTRTNVFIFLGRLWRLWVHSFSTQHSDFHTGVRCACPVAVFPDGLLELGLQSSYYKLRSHFQK